jgi:chromosome condensin MukBEF MukE localization factor
MQNWDTLLIAAHTRKMSEWRLGEIAAVLRKKAESDHELATRILRLCAEVRSGDTPADTALDIIESFFD